MSVFTNYAIKADCLITWFPVKSSAKLKEPRIRMSGFKHHADEQPFATGGKAGMFHGQALGGTDDGLTSTNLVRAITEVGVSADRVFFVDVELGIGRNVRNERLLIPSNSVVPFLFALRALREDDQEVANTAVAFQGVVTASRRRSELTFLVSRWFLKRLP